jgi:hypothetical protein
VARGAAAVVVISVDLKAAGALLRRCVSAVPMGRLWRLLHPFLLIRPASVARGLDPITEDHRVSERVAALERVSLDNNTFWVDARRCSAIVLLQDRVQHVGESIDGCRKSLTTMYFVMLPRNPPPENFGQLLEVFKMS